VAGVLVQRHEHPHAEEQQRRPDDGTHHVVHPAREDRAEGERERAEEQDDSRMAEGVHRAEQERALLLAQEANGRGGLVVSVGLELARSRLFVGFELGVPAVLVVMLDLVLGRVLVDRLVVQLGGVGGRRRRGHVGDGGEVVPVEAVADAQHERGRDQPEGAGVGHRRMIVVIATGCNNDRMNGPGGRRSPSGRRSRRCRRGCRER
jgi:hypothetical protein